MNAKKRKSKNYTDSNAISNSDTSPEYNDTSSDELLSEDNISADLNIITDHSDKTSDTDHSNKNNNPNLLIKNLLVKTQGSTSNFQTYLNTHKITKPTKVINTIEQPTITEMFYHAAGQNTRQKESINYALVKWIVTDLQPLYVLKNESFIKLIHTLNLYYELLSDKYKVLEELTIILASFAEITQLLGGSNYTTFSFIWLAITTLTRNYTPLSMSISNEELDLTNMLTIFDEEEENIVDMDKELEIIITANGGRFNLSQPQNMDNLVEKDASLDCSLIAMLLDPHCKSMKKLDSWEHDKAINLLREKYDLLSIRNESITNLVNVEKNNNQMSLFSIMFGSDIMSTSDKNEVDEYLK
ncbi:9986_t:CDS:2, partial [Scutellospora calospora]